MVLSRQRVRSTSVRPLTEHHWLGTHSVIIISHVPIGVQSVGRAHILSLLAGLVLGELILKGRSSALESASVGVILAALGNELPDVFIGRRACEQRLR